MNNIITQLRKIKESGKMGLMTHVIIGYPTLEATKKVIEALERGGSDFIELQIPFSDPIADGPTIMKASDIALKNGITTQDAMAIMKEMSGKVHIPLLFMCYFNTVYSYGVDEFCKEAAAAGASGLIVPDVPPEEEQYEHFITTVKKNNLILIRVISPASSKARQEKNAFSAEGFIYCISRYGVTGKASAIDPRLSEYLASVKSIFNLPRAVGFGISKPEQITALKNTAEIAVIGSAIVERIASSADENFSDIEQMVSTLKNA